MSEYSPALISDPAVAAEFLRLAVVLAEVQEQNHPQVHQEPVKPRIGMVRYADGTDWNPGNGEGLYAFSSIGWILLSAGFGLDGDSIFVGSVFLRKATPPTEPIDDDGSYNFTTNVLTPPSIGGGSDDNWSITVPAGSDDLYVSTGSFEISGPTGTDNTVDWTAPVVLASDGATGPDGNSVFVGSAFLRKASAPTKPIDDDGAYNFTTNVLVPPSTGGGSADDWSATVPAGSDDLYVVSGAFEINGVTGTDSTVSWSTPVILASDGAAGSTGASGDSVFVGNVFLRKGSAPTKPIDDDGQYNFTTNVLTAPSIGGGSADDWSTTVPAGSDPLYIVSGSFEINGVTGTDTTVVWSTPVIISQDGATGATGASGSSVFVGSVFLRKATPPTEPLTDDGQYNFTTNILTAPSIGGGSDDNWSITVPAGSDDLYVSTGSFEIVGATGTDTTVDWTAPVVLSSDGATGGDGNSVHVGSAFLRKASAPTKPIDDDGAYNFTTNVLTPPSTGGGSADDWSDTVPAGTDDLYVINGAFEINGVTGTDNTVVWSTPVILASDGADGATGSQGDPGDDGLDAVTGFLEAENGLAWTRATTGGAWTPSQLTSDLDVTFILGNTVVAKIARQITLTSATGNLAATTVAHKDSDLNTSRVTVTVSGSASTAISVKFDYSFGGDTGSISATLESVQGGDDGVLHFLTNEAHVVAADFDGGGYSLVGAGGTHKVFEGTTDETTNATHSIVAPATKNGLTIAVVAGTGVYSLSGASWTTDEETFIVRAVFNSVNYDKTYTIVKAKQGGDGGCAVTSLVTISESDVGVNPTATVGFRLHSNGLMFHRPNNPSGYSSAETWIGVCANSEYECNYVHSGDALTVGSASVNTWLACSTTRTYELETSGAIKNASGTFQIRRTSDDKVVRSVSVTLGVETNA